MLFDIYVQNNLLNALFLKHSKTKVNNNQNATNSDQTISNDNEGGDGETNVEHADEGLSISSDRNNEFGDAFRTFHDINGRTIEACLKNYDPQLDMVTVELRNKSVKKVKASVF